MVPALFPLRSCVCGGVQGIKSSSQTDPFSACVAWSWARKATPADMKCREGQIYGQVLFISGLSQGQSTCTPGLGVVPRVVGTQRLLSLGGLQGCHSQVTEELILLLGGEQLQQ